MLTMHAVQSSGATAPHQLDGVNLERLISLLSASATRTSEIATQVLAQYCQCADMVCKAADSLPCCLHLRLYVNITTSQTIMQEVLARLAQDPSVAASLMQLLLSQSSGQEAAVTALGLLTSSSISMAAQCSAHPQWQHSLLSLLKHSKPAARLAACVCLRNICLTPDIQDKVGATTVEVGTCISQLRAASGKASMACLLLLTSFPRQNSQLCDTEMCAVHADSAQSNAASAAQVVAHASGAGHSSTSAD